MKRCDKMVEVGRRQFLRGGIVAAAALPVVGLGAHRKPRPPPMAHCSIIPRRGSPTSRTSRSTSRSTIAYPDADAPACC